MANRPNSRPFVDRWSGLVHDAGAHGTVLPKWYVILSIHMKQFYEGAKGRDTPLGML